MVKKNKNIKEIKTEIKLSIEKDYKRGMSLRNLQSKYNVTRQSISEYLTKKGIKTTTGNHYRYYYHNFDFFEDIDNEEKAYWLGFMYADGYIVNCRSNGYRERSFGITLSIKDKEHLLKFRQAIEATNPINIYQRKNTSTTFVRLLLKSEKTVLDLIDKGCLPQKTKILKFPHDKVPKKLIRHFIRGYFDGDGSISLSKDTRTGKLTYHINIVGTENIVDNFIKEIGFGYKIKEKRSERTYYYSYDAKKYFYNLYYYLYENSSVYLERKKEKFDIFKTNMSKDRV